MLLAVITKYFDLKYALGKLKQLALLSLIQVLSIVINSHTAEKAFSASTDVGGMHYIAAVILVMSAVFSSCFKNLKLFSNAPANCPTCLGCFRDALCLFFYCSLQFLKHCCCLAFFWVDSLTMRHSFYGVG